MTYCPWCDQRLEPDQDWAERDGKRWHVGCLDDYWKSRYEEATLRGET